MLDYNFSYLQEVVAVFQQYKEVARCKDEAKKKEYLYNAKKYESKARKCMEAYKIRVDKLSQTLQGVKSEAETQTDPSPMTPPIKHGRGRNKTRGYRNNGDRQPESNLTTFSNHNRDHEVEPSPVLNYVNPKKKIAEWKRKKEEEEEIESLKSFDG